jgi:hypothetical protein
MTHRVLIPQNVLPFVCFACHSDMPLGEKAKDEPLTLIPAWQCRVISSTEEGVVILIPPWRQLGDCVATIRQTA